MAITAKQQLRNLILSALQTEYGVRIECGSATAWSRYVEAIAIIKELDLSDQLAVRSDPSSATHLLIIRKEALNAEA